MKYLRLLLANFRRRRLRTAFTILSIAVAFVLFVLLSAVRMAFSLGVEMAGVDRLMTLNKVSIILPLPVSYKERIAQIPGVTAVTHADWFGGYYKDKKNAGMGEFPVPPEEYLAMYPEYLIPSDQKAAWIADREGVLVGRQTAERFGWKVGDRIPIIPTIWRRADGKPTWEFNVRAIFDGTTKNVDTTLMLFHYDYFDEARAYGKGTVGWYILKIADPEKAPAVAKAIDEQFANSPFETKTNTEKAFVLDFAKQIGNISLIITLILIAVFAALLLMTGTSIAHSIRERTAELAVLKTIGFSGPLVMGLVIGEALLVVAVGGALGLGLGWAWVTAMGDPTHGFLPLFYFPPRDFVTGGILIVLLGAVTGAFPAWRALRLSISDGLRRG